MAGTQKRSLAKTVTWRVVATLTTIAIVYFFTRELTISLGVAMVEVVAKTLIYYFHERVWSGVTWQDGSS